MFIHFSIKHVRNMAIGETRLFSFSEKATIQNTLGSLRKANIKANVETSTLIKGRAHEVIECVAITLIAIEET